MNLALISRDDTPANDIAIQTVPIERHTGTENCLNWVDDDCNGLIDCFDPACTLETCVIDYQLVAHAAFPQPLPPPIILPIDNPDDMPFDPLHLDWRHPPPPPPDCFRSRHGMPVKVPNTCCDPQPPPGSTS